MRTRRSLAAQRSLHPPSKFISIDQLCRTGINLIEPPKDFFVPGVRDSVVSWRIEALHQFVRELRPFNLGKLQNIRAQLL
jgi:hypothetical protein